MRAKKRRKIDKMIQSLIYLISFIGVIIFVSIIGYIVTTGGKLLSFELLTGNYQAKVTDIFVESNGDNYTYPSSENEYYSPRWDIAVKDSINKEGNPIVEISYIGDNSPMKKAKNLNDCLIGDKSFCSEYSSVNIVVGNSIKTVIMDDYNQIAYGKYKAEAMVKVLEKGSTINSMSIQKEGGGIRGSIITTIYLIVLTLILAVPVGVFTALHLKEYSKNKKSTYLIRSMIDLLTGVPSIIYGMIGVVVVIPMLNIIFKTNGSSILAGAFTMAIILLPTIIKNTEEALKVIPQEIRAASLALGASKTQTTFKVVLPSAIPGILTGVLLGIGRIIGESAALVLVMGAAIKDQVSIKEGSTTLAVHIWQAVGGEQPNYELAAAISIVILIVVFILNRIAKIIAKKMNKSWY